MALTQIVDGNTMHAADINQCVDAINGIQVAQATGSTSGPTTSSSTPAQLAEMSVTMTTVGGVLVAWFDSVVSNSSSSFNVWLAPYLDGLEGQASSVILHQGTGFGTISGTAVWTGVTPGSHTVAVYWWVDGGTGTANSVRRQLTVMNLP